MRLNYLLIPLLFITPFVSAFDAAESGAQCLEKENAIEKDRFNTNESDNRIVFSVSNGFSIAYSSYEASYTDEGINLTVRVKDDDLFYGNIYNLGYDDNFEFLINVKSDSAGWVVDKTHHFIMSGDGRVAYERANSANGLGKPFEKEMKVVLGENLDYTYTLMNKENAYYNGFKAEIFIAYDALNTTKEEAKGNLTICPGMRNAHGYNIASFWGTYAQKGCNWSNSSSFVQIKADGTFTGNE